MRFSTRLWDGPGLCRMSLFVLLDDSGLLSRIYDINESLYIVNLGLSFSPSSPVYTFVQSPIPSQLGVLSVDRRVSFRHVICHLHVLFLFSQLSRSLLFCFGDYFRLLFTTHYYSHDRVPFFLLLGLSLHDFVLFLLFDLLALGFILLL